MKCQEDPKVGLKANKTYKPLAPRINMLLKSLTLENIRSYTKATINFPEGSTVLAGDIGVGKSTILLAIEFALFGTSRTNLPGELLLRKGTTQGAAILTFSLNDQEYEIKRTLKRDKNGVKQTTGHIIENGRQKELTALELKSAILEKLGYPAELLTKSKNFIFRYTLYTPQEEMKFILQENDDTRLDVLRKIFNIDKYKIIRDNLTTTLKNLRAKIATKKTRLEPLPGLQEEKKELSQELTTNLEKQKDLTTKHEQQTKILQEQQEKFKSMKKKCEILREIHQNHISVKTRLETTQQQLSSVEVTINQTQEQLLTLAPSSKEIDKQNLTTSLKQLQHTFITTNDQISKVTSQITSTQSHLKTTKIELSSLEQDASTLSQKKQKVQELKEQLAKIIPLQEKQESLQKLLQQTDQIITKNQTLCEQSQIKIDSTKELDTCPTCFQSVTAMHKRSLLIKEQKKQTQAQDLISQAQQKKQEINVQLQKNNQLINDLKEKQEQLTRLELELSQLLNIDQKIATKRQVLQTHIEQNSKYMKNLSELQITQASLNFEQKQQEIQEALNQINKVFHLQDKLQTDKQTKEKLTESLLSLQTQVTKYNQQELNQITCNLQEIETQIEKQREIQSKLSISLTQIQTRTQEQQKQMKKLESQLTILKQEQMSLIKLKEIYTWLEKHFLPLTNAIEKQVMYSIYTIFNQLFQEWFSLLIDDDMIYARIDDTFSPVIEQNGYEVSFQNLSGGEKTSAALAYRLALNRVINEVIQDIKTKDVIILDEPTDGFSSQQLDKVRDVLDRLNLRQTIIVSHESKIESFVDNVIRIDKSGHVSSVTQ